MKVDPNIYCHRRLLLLTQIVSTVSLTTNGRRRLLHTIKPDPGLAASSVSFWPAFRWRRVELQIAGLTPVFFFCSAFMIYFACGTGPFLNSTLSESFSIL